MWSALGEAYEGVHVVPVFWQWAGVPLARAPRPKQRECCDSPVPPVPPHFGLAVGLPLFLQGHIFALAVGLGLLLQRQARV